MTTEQRVSTRRVSDILGDGHVNFHDDLPKLEMKDIQNRDVLLEEIQPMRGWTGQYGTRDWYLLRVTVDGVSCTTKVGGVAVNKRLEDLIRRKALPITAQFILEGEGDRLYWNVV